jgi:hypothetical protein
MVLRPLMLTAILLSILGGCAQKETSTLPDGTKVEVNQDGNSLKVSSDKGSASLGVGTTVTEEELDIPFYPGSTEKPESSVKVELSSEKSYMTVRTTPDEPEKVAEFYKTKLTDVSVSAFELNEKKTAIIAGKTPSGMRGAVTASREKDSQETTIQLASGQEGPRN